MSRLNINIGTSANDRTGDPLRTAFDKVNQNFVELYTTITSIPADISDLTDTTNLLSGGSLTIPGPYINDAAASAANVSVGSPYYQTSGQVFVRLI
jgi:hypothetical protein